MFPSIDNYCLVAGNIHRICSEDLGRTVVAGDTDVELELLNATARLREPHRTRQLAKTFIRLWLLSWQESGRPHLRFVDERVPLTLMATVADPTVAELVLPPWPAFVVDLPRGALRADSSVSLEGSGAACDARSESSHAERVRRDQRHPGCLSRCHRGLRRRWRRAEPARKDVRSWSLEATASRADADADEGDPGRAILARLRS